MVLAVKPLMLALMRWSTVGSEDRTTLVIHWNTETQLYLGRKQTDPILLDDSRLNKLLGGIERPAKKAFQKR